MRTDVVPLVVVALMMNSCSVDGAVGLPLIIPVAGSNNILAGST